MSAVFLSPHNDDETLFGAFTIVRYRPHVVVCFKSVRQSLLWRIEAHTRQAETDAALRELGAPSWEQWDVRDDLTVDEARVELEPRLRALERERRPELVFAPASHDGGHEQHELVGELARAIFCDRVYGFASYANGRGRVPLERVDAEPEAIGAKVRALACYTSQATLRSTAHHFVECQIEYLDRMPS